MINNGEKTLVKMVVTWSWCALTIWCVVVILVLEVATLSGPNVCVMQQKYNITKRVKYRAPMSVRTYVWCFSVPPRCSQWSTEMRELTRLETGERTAEVAVCCPGYKMRDVSCVPICPSGKTGNSCSEDCPADKWGPNCASDCGKCLNGICDPITGECDCDEGWQGESCQVRMSTTSPPALMEKILTTTKSTVQTLASSVSIALTPLSTTVLQIFTTPKTTIITLPTTRMTSISTEKIETTPITFKLPVKTTADVSYNNTTITPSTTLFVDNKESSPKTTVTHFIYNRTETPEAGTSSNFLTEHVSSTVKSINTTVSMASSSSTHTPSIITSLLTNPIQTTTLAETKTTSSTTSSRNISSTKIPVTTSTLNVSFTENFTRVTPKLTTIPVDKGIRQESTAKPETTMKNQPVTIKFKPKEIWIKPSQKGDSIFFESKIKGNHEMKYKTATNKIEVSESTTPKTIIVSIIPTSISHATFKKIALTTASYLSQMTNFTLKPINKSEQGYTKSMSSRASTAIPFTIKILSTLNEKNFTFAKTTNHLQQNNTAPIPTTPISKKLYMNTSVSEASASKSKAILNTSLVTNRTTNSMLNVESKIFNTSTSSTKISITNQQNLYRNSSNEITTPPLVFKKVKNASVKIETAVKTYKTNFNTNKSVKAKNKTTEKPSNFPATTERTNSTKRTASKILNFNKITTQEPSEDETFHILTEPEHITAVMSDKERHHTSVDLISLISIAGGVMMAIITVAVIIVMVERCKRHRYDDVRKINDIRMQVMIDNKDVPPPYVRSIFHTPLPDPPSSDRNHYQPISTLDRNLKQFMRPVVVQTISPIMLENFRGILECHYDHLPNTNQDLGTMPVRCSVASSMKYDEKLLSQRPLSVADYTIEALKCEAKLDVIDCTTSEPLYAEIPCWRPPSEHAIEVVNLNGEAVTEL